MISKEKLEANFKKFCEENELINERIVFEEYHLDDNFFDKDESVWDEISYLDGDRNTDFEENQDNLEIDIEGWFYSDYPKCPNDFPINDEVMQTISDYVGIPENTEDQWYDLEYLGFKFYKDLPDNMKETVDEWWDQIDENYLNEYDEWFYGLLNLSEDAWYTKDNFIEKMAYWTIYFVPRYDNWCAAWESELIPFKYYRTFMLALGGCGMDLSAKLDCYQALVDKSLPSNSCIFRDQKYFDYVSPIKHEEIFNKCRREHVKVVLNAEIKE